jgi:serine protease
LARAALDPSALGVSPDHVVVRFADDVPPWQAEQIAQSLGGSSVEPARFGSFARVELAPGETPERVAERLSTSAAVEWAATDPLVHAAFGGARNPRAASGGARAGRAASGGTGAVRAAQVLNDPFFPEQWHFHRIGLEEALERNPSDGEGVIVAVLDTGVAFGSGGSFPSRRGPDLEGTRFAPGFDFISNDAVPFDEGSGDPGELRFGHGTFVTSIIAATVDNGVAGSSIAPRVTILPVRVLGVDGFGSSSVVAEGINFAVSRGAKVINMSLGGAERSQLVANAVAAAESAGVVLVAAAGNEAEDEAFADELGNDVAFPARFEQVIAVGATTFEDARAPYSNFGPALDLMAPGGEDNEEVGDDVLDGILATSFVHDPRTAQTTFGAFWAVGTSFATAHVSGVAALLVSLGVEDPAAVRLMLELTAFDLGGDGFDAETAHGRLDAAASHRGIGFTS